MKKTTLGTPMKPALLPDDHISIEMTRREWTVLFNVIVSQSYKFGVAVFLKSIVDKIEPHVAVDTNIKKEQND